MQAGCKMIFATCYFFLDLSVMATAIRLLAIDLLVCTMGADALYNISNVFDLKSLWHLDHGDFLLFQTEGLAAFQAGEMHVLAFFVMMVMAMILMAAAVFFDACAMLLADTIFMLATAVLNDV